MGMHSSRWLTMRGRTRTDDLSYYAPLRGVAPVVRSFVRSPRRLPHIKCEQRARSFLVKFLPVKYGNRGAGPRTIMQSVEGLRGERAERRKIALRMLVASIQPAAQRNNALTDAPQVNALPSVWRGRHGWGSLPAPVLCIVAMTRSASRALLILNFGGRRDIFLKEQTDNRAITPSDLASGAKSDKTRRTTRTLVPSHLAQIYLT